MDLEGRLLHPYLPSCVVGQSLPVRRQLLDTPHLTLLDVNQRERILTLMKKIKDLATGWIWGKGKNMSLWGLKLNKYTLVG